MLKSFSSILKTSTLLQSSSSFFSSSILKSGRVLCSRSKQTLLSFASRQFSYTTDLGMDYVKDKAKYLNLSLDSKRSEYYCKSDYVTLQDIKPWSDHIKKVLPTHEKALFPSNPGLNEKISIFTGDITALEIDAVVNAANNTLKGGGGVKVDIFSLREEPPACILGLEHKTDLKLARVDGAIHRAAGKRLLIECSTLGGCETGDAKITGGYKLPAKYVIHTVGPHGENRDLLDKCYRKSLKVAMQNGLRTVAFPCISTGVYCYPNQKAAVVALKAVREVLEANESSFDRVIFCLFLPVDVAIYETLAQEYFPA